jgi:ABC-type uncharacterized transport system permease subunit
MATVGHALRLCCAFYQPQQTMQKNWAKTILLSQTGIDFSASNFSLQGHILSYGGVALIYIYMNIPPREEEGSYAYSLMLHL